MLSKRLALGARLGWASATFGALAIVACASGGGDVEKTGEATTIGDYHVDVAPKGATMKAVVTDATGAVVFTYEGLFEVDGFPAARGTLASNGATGYHRFPESTIPSAAYFAKAAYYDYVGTSKAYSKETAYDNQGCDMLPEAVSCSTNNGSCCDTHDACYAKNGCSAASWAYTGYLTSFFSKCSACNTAVVSCFAGGGSGPSACCSTGTCGQPWGKPGQGGQCLCQDKPNDCNSSACTGSDGGAGADAEQGGDGGASQDGSQGDGGSGGGDGGGDYATTSAPMPPRHHPIVVEPGGTRTVAFEWRDASGVAAPADLWVEVGGKTVLQVASRDGHPFARAGLDVAPLASEAPYRLVVARAGDTVKITVATAGGAEMLHAEAPAGRAALRAPVADVVLPAASLREAIVSELQ